MRFIPASLEGVFLVEPEPASDARGYFARTFCVREFAARGLETEFPQHSFSYSAARGTLRGMHFQRPPHEEVKVVSCTKGAIHDVLVDLRPASATYLQWQGFDLTAANHLSLYVPKGVAHGFLTMEEDCEVSYLISAFHLPEAAAGVRYDDPAIGIAWPMPVSVISERDLAWDEYAGFGSA